MVLTLLSMITFVAASAVVPRDPPSTYGLWSSLGCWGDSPVNRTLHHTVGSSSTNTVESCLDTCHSLRFPLAGVEYSSECYCGNAILYNYGTSTGCTMACSGAPAEKCGGPNAINIYNYNSLLYTVGPASAIFSYNGYSGYSNDVYGGLCYRSNSFAINFGGTLRYRPVPAIPDEELTVERCINACHAQSYQVAGLQFGQQCWCDFQSPSPLKLPLGDNLPNSVCSFPCTGNATEFCGGGSGAVLAYSF